MSQNELKLQPQNNSIVSLIKSLNILSTQDIQRLEDSKAFIAETIQDVPMYRSLTTKIFGVLNDKEFPNPESKYWQCKVEAEVHSDQLIQDIHRLETMKINIEKMKFIHDKIQKLFDSEFDEQKKTEYGFDLRLQGVNLSLLEYQATKLSKQIKYRIQEVWEWKKISDKLQENNNIENISYIEQQVKTMKQKLEKADRPESEKEKASNVIDSLVSMFS